MHEHKQITETLQIEDNMHVNPYPNEILDAIRYWWAVAASNSSMKGNVLAMH